MSVLQNLYQISMKLDENKADKEFVQSEVDVVGETCRLT